MPTQVIDFGKDAGQTEHRRLADLPDRVVAGDPHHQTTTFFRSPAGEVVAGTWTSTPGRWVAFTDRNEFCVITQGHVRLIADDGSAQSFKAGDAFLIPDGFRGFWEVLETTTKHFVVHNVAQSGAQSVAHHGQAPGAPARPVDPGAASR